MNLQRDWALGLQKSNRVIGYATGSVLDGATASNKFAKKSVVAAVAAVGDDAGMAVGGSSSSSASVLDRWLAGKIEGRFRDVKSAIGWPKDAPEIEWLTVPCPKAGTRSHPILCPIAMLERVYADRKRFQEHVVGDAGTVKRLWDGLKAKRDVLYQDNRDRIGDTSRCLIFGFHGDGAPTNKVDGLYTISYGSLTGKGSTKDVRFPFTVLRSSEETKEVMDVLFLRMAWAFNALLAGVYPELDFYGNVHPRAGQPIRADGWRMIMLHLRGDWEFYQHVLGFPAPNAVPNNCFKCLGSPTLDALLYTNAKLGAGWRPTVRSHAKYLLELARLGVSLPAVFAMLSLRHEGIMIDVMHACDLGMCSHIVANVIVECLDHFDGGTIDERTAACEEYLNEWVRSQDGSGHGLRGRLTFARLRTAKDWPKLKGKAAETRHMIDFAVHLAGKFNDGSTHDQRRLAVPQLMQEFYQIIDRNDIFLSSEDGARVGDIARDFMSIYGKLSREALLGSIRAWKMPPKFHMWVHICEIQALHMNPRLFWTYVDEDMQRQIKAMALSCHPRTVCENVLFKWIVLIFG